MKKRVLLDEEDFEKLVSGGVIEQNDVEIALSDIGYYNMIDLILSKIEK